MNLRPKRITGCSYGTGSTQTFFLPTERSHGTKEVYARNQEVLLKYRDTANLKPKNVQAAQ